MKKFFKIIGIFLIFIIIALVTLPVLFKGKIIKKIKTEINNNVDAHVDFNKVTLSFIKSFPGIYFSVKDISVICKNEFKNEKLLSVGEISAKISFSSIFKKQINVTSVKIVKPEIYAHISKDGKANWDIAKNKMEKKEDVSNKSTSSKAPPQTDFKLLLKEFTIDNANLIFRDDSQHLKAKIKNLSYSLNGDFNLSKSILNMILKIKSLSVQKDGIKFLNNVAVSYHSKINADLNEKKFTFSDNKFTLNKIALSFKGYVKQLDEKTVFADVHFGTNKNNFKDLLSLVPAIFLKDYKEIKTHGNIQLSGFLKGKISQKIHPSFGLKLFVNNAGFQYPDLPAAANDIYVNLQVSNPDGIDDHTVINLKRFSIKLGGNPFSANYVIKTPISDPSIEGSIKGKINFDTLKDVLPIQDIKMNGILTTDISMKGKMSFIEKQQFDKFHAKGSFGIVGFNFKTKELPYQIKITKALVKVSPRFLTLNKFDCKVGESDFHITGQILNFLGFYMKNEILKGRFFFSSNLMNLNQLVPKTQQTVADNSQQQNSTEIKPIAIPQNIDFLLNLNLKKILFQKMKISGLNGQLKLKNGIASLNNINMNLIDGNLKLNGSFNGVSEKNHKIHFDMKLSKIDIPKAFNTFNTVQKLAPIAKNCKGKISMKLSLDAMLDQNLQPVISSFNGKGKLSSEKIVIGGSETMEKVAKLLKNNKYKKLDLKNVNASFKMINGDIIISPVTIKVHNSTAVFSGKQRADLTMDYLLKLKIPYKDLGNASKVIENLKSKGGKWLKYIDPGKSISIKVYIKGSLQHPEVSLGIKDLADRLKAEIVAKLKKKAEKEARKQADKILAEANKQADKLVSIARKKAKEIKKAGKKAANEVIKKADKKIDEMVNKAHGSLAKSLAKEAGKSLKKEARKKAKLIEDEANKKAEQLVKETKKQTEKIKADAKKKADQLIKKAIDSVKL